jgi:hypothetical protein
MNQDEFLLNLEEAAKHIQIASNIITKLKMQMHRAEQDSRSTTTEVPREKR